MATGTFTGFNTGLTAYPGAHAPDIYNVSPADMEPDAEPKVVIEFDAISPTSDLILTSLQVSVNGYGVLTAGSSIPHGGWKVTFTAIQYGYHVKLEAPDFFPPYSAEVVVATVSDVSNGTTTYTWSFSVTAPAVVQTYEVLDALRVRLTFSLQLFVDGELLKPSNYGVSVRLGTAQPAYVKTVTAPFASVGQLASEVIVSMRDYLSLNGRYAIRLQGMKDQYGRVVDTSHSFNAS